MIEDLTEEMIEAVADCLRSAGFEFDIPFNNDDYIKIIYAVLMGLGLDPLDTIKLV